MQNFSFLLLIGLSLFSSLQVTAQKDKDTYQKQVDEYLNTLDLSGIKNNLLLNKSAFTTDELEYFRKPDRNRKGQIVANINAQEWQSLYERFSMADLRKGNDKIPDVGALVEQDADKRSKNNVIPIGILNLDATFLDEKQVDENKKEKQQGKKAKSESYEKVFFLAAAVLQKDIYQADVSFKIDPSLHISNNKNEIKRFEIDFQDGKGYQSFEMKAKSIPYRFTSTGERIITLRIYTQRGTYVFHSRIDVKQLEWPKVYREFTVTAEAVRQDTISVNSRLQNGRAAVSVPGANTRIILGCDQVFNKPIIIAEGFDFKNENSLDGLQAESIATFQPYMNQGYDLVLVDYHNARDFIENNAEVLKNVILQVNNEKVGNEQLIVVGQSMSGLVGRWALRKMENDGIAHNVKLFIPFDTPHQGANVPVSLTQMYWAANPSFLTNVFLRIFSTFGNYYSAIQTPAATQMLLHWGRPNQYGVGNKHPEFDSFRTRLQAMGNGGYPQNCRNIAMINGSLDASDRALFTRYNYGSNLISSRLWVPGQLAYIEAYTNQLNNNSRILNFWANGFYLWGGALINYGSAFNNDFLPGGRSNFAIPQRILKNTRSFDFCFVPTFSSIDYQGSRNSQSERELLNVNNARNAGQTPFAAVYGNFNNTEHISRAVPWFALGIAENLFNNPGCPAVQPPPAPNFYANSVPCLADPSTDPASVIVNINMLSPTQGQYTNSWSVQPTGQTYTSSGDSFNFSVSEPGEYTVTCTRSFPNRPDLNSSTSIVVTVNYCNAGGIDRSGPNGTCGYIEGDFVYVLDNGQNVYARYHNGTLYAVAQSGDTYLFTSRNTLLANGMFGNFASCFAETDPRGGGGNLPFQNGCFTLKSKLSNKMMQMDNDGNGARVRQYNANGQNNQVFKLEAVDGDAYKIMAATSNRTIEAPNGNTGYGTELQLWDYNGGNHQKWQFVNMNDGSYRLNPKHTNQMVMDVSQNNSNDGNLIHLWGIHNGDNQRFIFQSVGCPQGGTPPSGGCGTGTGLTANYFNGNDLQGSPIATLTQATIDFAGNDGQTIAGTNVAGSNVSARWEGQIEAPVSGSYSFNIRTDDGVRLWFNNQQVVNDYGYYPPTDHSFTVSLNAGTKYNLKIEWKQGGGGYEAKLFWSYPGQATQIVPACRLYPTTGGGTPPSGSGCVVNKVRLKFRSDCCLDRLNGAQIQGSNDGSNWTNLYTINQNATGSWQEFVFGNGTVYQRVRFVSGPNGFGELYEIEFYKNNSKLSGTAFGNGAQDPGSSWENAIDGNENSFWHGPWSPNWLPGANNYVGLLLDGNCPAREGIAGEKEFNHEDSQQIQLYPNPTDGKVTVRYELEKGQKATLQFINAKGQVLIQKSMVGEGGWQQNQTDLSAQPDGTYVVRMETQQKTVSRKFVIVK